MTWRGRTLASWWLSGSVCFEPPPEPAARPSEAAPPATTPPEEREYLSIATAAQYLDCSEGLIRKLLAAPKDPLPSITLGRARRIHRAALDSWIARRMVSPGTVDDALNLNDVLERIRRER